jgi:citrate synthase
MNSQSNAQEPLSRSDYLPASAVMRILGIRLQTLYAYASRGWLRSVRQPGRKEHLYAFDDVEKLRVRSDARRGHGAVAAGGARQAGWLTYWSNV